MSEPLTQADLLFLKSSVAQLMRLAAKLRAQARPGHVDYVNKADAATVVYSVADDISRRFPIETVN